MYYLDGWRYGIIRRIPIKGERKGMVQMEVPVDRWKFEDGKWIPKARDKAWVPARNLRELDAMERGRIK